MLLKLVSLLNVKSTVLQNFYIHTQQNCQIYGEEMRKLVNRKCAHSAKNHYPTAWC